MSAAWRGKLYVAGRVRGRPLAADDALFLLRTGRGHACRRHARGDAAAGAAIVRAESFYVVGGVTAGTSGGRALARTALVYDIARRRWSSIPGPTHARASRRDDPRRAHLCGRRTARGRGHEPRAARVLRPGATKWRRLRYGHVAARGGTAAAGLGRWLVSAGGETPTVTIRTVYRYDVRKRRWSRLPNLPTPRHGLGVVAFGSKVYVLAGGTTPGLAGQLGRTSLWRFDSEAGHGAPGRPCRRRRRRCRSAGTCRRSRGTARASAGSRADPRAQGCARTRAAGPRRRKSRPAR